MSKRQRFDLYASAREAIELQQAMNAQIRDAAPDLLAALKAQEEADRLSGIYRETGARADYLAWECADARAIGMRRAILAKLEAEE